MLQILTRNLKTNEANDFLNNKKKYYQNKFIKLYGKRSRKLINNLEIVDVAAYTARIFNLWCQLG